MLRLTHPHSNRSSFILFSSLFIADVSKTAVPVALELN
jgi:hypothetical protein